MLTRDDFHGTPSRMKSYGDHRRLSRDGTMLARDEWHGIPERWRPPVICGSPFEPRPREPRDCHICLKPLPLIRHPNMSVCPPGKGESESACQAENKRRIMARATARWKARKAEEKARKAR